MAMAVQSIYMTVIVRYSAVIKGSGGSTCAKPPEQARADILEACVNACKLMQYRGAGTFEFLFEKANFLH